MNKFVFLVLFSLAPLVSFSQLFNDSLFYGNGSAQLGTSLHLNDASDPDPNLILSENFNDGLFYGDGRSVEWTGDENKFVVNESNQLQLNTSGSGIAQLKTSLVFSRNMQWEWWTKLDFNPSTNNYARVFLCSDENSLLDPNGLFIRIGYTDKNVSLIQARKEQNNRTLIKGTTDRLNINPDSIRIKATLDNNGIFNLYSKLDDEPDYVLEGSDDISDEIAEMFESNVFGIVCYFTTLRSNSFYFDDFVVRELDTDPNPNPTSIETISITYPEFDVDNYSVNYRLDKPGYRCQAFVYDAMGRKVNVIANNEILETEGQLSWNGRGNSNQPLVTGIYIIYMEVYDMAGNVKKFRKPVTVK
ncbi:MAG: hypothetical protein LBE71_00055 [Dysgonamonadaceae bacterium]|jgi:hypothetical protein|nr:hypothetical protein [Dysgonamonadaceae bacterium]